MSAASGMDESARQLLASFKASGRRPYEELSPIEARDQQRAAALASQPNPPVIAAIEDMMAPAPAAPIPLRLYRSNNTPSASSALIFFHGGGWVLGSIATHDPLCRAIANAAGCTVISVEYRLAPEHRFPAAIDDVSAATDWIMANAAALGIDPARVAVGGDSAGANLATVVALTSNRKRHGLLAAQVLLYPAVDMRMQSASHRAFAADLLLTHRTMLWFRELYLCSNDEQLDWRASPCLSRDLAISPSALVITAGYDPLCDEGRDFAQALTNAGITVTHSHFGGQMHGFMTMPKFIPEAQNAILAVGNYLKLTLQASAG
jgi:acetyl esterase